MPTRVRKAVFPVAGLGTRLLPATKSIPKEMITIVDRPLIQYAVDEAREAGIEQLIFVTGRGKSALVDYFDQAYELEATLKGKNKSLDVLEPSNARFGEVVSVQVIPRPHEDLPGVLTFVKAAAPAAKTDGAKNNGGA